MQSGTVERETSNREWRRPREFPKGALTPCTPSHPFDTLNDKDFQKLLIRNNSIIKSQDKWYKSFEDSTI